MGIYDNVKKVVLQVIKELNIPLIISATVVSYSAPNAVVLLAGSSTNTTIPNKSGITLVANDIVEIIVKNGDYSNMFIGWKR